MPPVPDRLTPPKMPVPSSITTVRKLAGSVQTGPNGEFQTGAPEKPTMTMYGTVLGTADVWLVIDSTTSVLVPATTILRENSANVPFVCELGVLAVTVMTPPKLLAVTIVCAKPLPSAI